MASVWVQTLNRFKYNFRMSCKTKLTDLLQSLYAKKSINIVLISLTKKPDANDIKTDTERKLSPCIPKKKKKRRASMTVEAALIFPLILFLLLTILYLFQIQRLQMEVREAIYDSAENIAESAYAMELISEKSSEELSDLLSGVTGEINLQNEIKDSSLLSLILGGRAGIICTMESDNDNLVVINAYMVLRLPKIFPWKKNFVLQERVCVKKWTGYDPNSTDQQEMVYTTQSGEVYHEDRDCSYLNPSIHVVAKEQVASKRNESGGIYKKCPLCGKQVGAICYITDYGEVYHGSLSCSGLKRTIYCVPADETEKRACSKCGGSHKE